MCLNPIPIRRRADEQALPELQPSGVKFYLVPCGRCWQCVNRRKSDWTQRIREEFKQAEQVVFLTLTFSDRFLPSDRPTLSKYVRQWKDNVRKLFGYFPKHFLCTERGTDEDGTRRLHIHGFLFLKHRLCPPVKRDPHNPKVVLFVPRETALFFASLRNTWKFGTSWLEEAYSMKSVSYSMKYIFKGFMQRRAGDFVCSKIYASLGFGDELFFGKTPEQIYHLFGEEPDEYNGYYIYDEDRNKRCALCRYAMEKIKTYIGFRKLTSFEKTLERCRTIEERIYNTMDDAREARLRILKQATREGLYAPRFVEVNIKLQKFKDDHPEVIGVEFCDDDVGWQKEVPDIRAWLEANYIT